MSACPEKEQPRTAFKSGKGCVFKTEMPVHRSVDAYKHIYQLHSLTVYSLCLRIVGSRAEAEALTQEAFVNLFRQLDSCHGDAALGTLLCRFAITAVRRRLHNEEPQCDTSLRAWTGSHGQSCALHAIQRVPQSASTSAVGRWRLKWAIVDLPLDLRVVIVLHDVLGYEHGEVAEILGSSPDASKSQLHKARLLLRELLYASTSRPGSIDNDLRAKQGPESLEYAMGSTNRGQVLQIEGRG